MGTGWYFVRYYFFLSRFANKCQSQSETIKTGEKEKSQTCIQLDILANLRPFTATSTCLCSVALSRAVEPYRCATLFSLEFAVWLGRDLICFFSLRRFFLAQRRKCFVGIFIMPEPMRNGRLTRSVASFVVEQTKYQKNTSRNDAHTLTIQSKIEWRKKGKRRSVEPTKEVREIES